MPVLKEFVCSAHGPFESFEGICPSGCSARFVTREFRTAPGIKSGKTRNTDRNLRALANDFKLPDVKCEEGMSVMDNLRRKKYQKNEQPASAWASVPGVKPGWVQREEQAPTYDVRTAGVLPGRAVESGTLPKVKPVFVHPKQPEIEA